jgi:hypothetical protein
MVISSLRRRRGVHVVEIYKARSGASLPVAQVGVLVGLRVQLLDGLVAPGKNRPQCRLARLAYNSFIRRGSGVPGEKLLGNGVPQV